MRYLIAGGCTTAVNLVTFFLLRVITPISRNTCNAIAIAMAIAFAYFANKFFVFQSKKKGFYATLVEAVQFVGARLESSSLDYHGQSVELTKNELKILYYLFKNGGKICSRGDMIEYLWDNQLYVDDNALSVNINRIREKLAGIGLTDFIKTKHRQGYTI